MNKPVVYDFLERECNKRGLGERRRLKYTRIIRIVVGYLGDRPLTSLSQEDMESLFLWLKNANEYRDDTKKDYWNMLRILARWLNPKVTLNDYKLKVKTKRVLPENVLSEKDILKLVETAETIRYKAMITLLYESGCRVGELLSLRIADLTFDDYGAVIVVNGKTGMRRIRLINAVPLLAQYLQEHRFREDPQAPLFYRIDHYNKKPLSETAINKLLKECAKKVGINKRIYPHLLRHSRATHLAKQLTEQELKVYFGWGGDSTMAATYVHLSGEDIEKKILEINGLKPVEKANNTLKPQVCIRCTHPNDASAVYCCKCGMVLDIKESLLLSNNNPPIVSIGAASNEGDFFEFLKYMYAMWKKNKTTKFQQVTNIE